MRAAVGLKPLFGCFKVLGVVSLGFIAIGCGGGNDVAPAADAPVRRGEAIDLAQEVNLRHADVPYLVQGEIRPGHRHVHLAAQFARCAGTANSTHHALGPPLNSPRFGVRGARGHGFVLVVSQVSVWSSPAFAKAQHASDTRRGRACRERQMLRLAPLGRGVSAAVHALPSPVSNIGAFEVRMRAYSPLMEIPVYFDLINFLCGPAEVELLVETSPVSAKPRFEKQLLSILYDRARTSDLVARTSGSETCGPSSK